MEETEYHIGSGEVLIDGKAIGAVKGVEFTWAPAEAQDEAPERVIRPGPITVSGKVDMSTIRGLDTVFGPPPSGPPVFNVTPGDAKPGQTIRARNLTQNPTATGTDVQFTSIVEKLDVSIDPETGLPRFVVVADGGYEFPVPREKFIDLWITMLASNPNERRDLDEYRRELEERLPGGKK
jgi:hypothetical protein